MGTTDNLVWFDFFKDIQYGKYQLQFYSFGVNALVSFKSNSVGLLSWLTQLTP